MNTQEKWILMFAGQGSPAIGMGNKVCDIDKITRSIWDCASDISGIDLRKLNRTGPMPKLMQTRYQQLLITTINIAYFSQFMARQTNHDGLTLGKDSAEDLAQLDLRQACSLQEHSLQQHCLQEHALQENCTAVLGHSAGEYSALYAAGVFSLETLFELINQRAIIMQQIAEKQKCLMYNVRNASIDAIQQTVQRLCLTDSVFIACDNGIHQVIAGQDKALKEVCHALMRQGKDVVKLGVNGAWHTPLMHEGVDEMRACLAKYPFKSPTLPLLMNNTGLFTQDVNQIKENLALHLENCVQFRCCLEALSRQHSPNILEIGHKKTLTYLCQDFYQQSQNVAFVPQYQHIHELLNH